MKLLDIIKDDIEFHTDILEAIAKKEFPFDTDDETVVSFHQGALKALKFLLVTEYLNRTDGWEEYSDSDLDEIYEKHCA